VPSPIGAASGVFALNLKKRAGKPATVSQWVPAMVVFTVGGAGVDVSALTSPWSSPGPSSRQRGRCPRRIPKMRLRARRQPRAGAVQRKKSSFLRLGGLDGVGNLLVQGRSRVSPTSKFREHLFELQGAKVAPRHYVVSGARTTCLKRGTRLAGLFTYGHPQSRFLLGSDIGTVLPEKKKKKKKKRKKRQ
jgi:hypothetical protein